MKVIINKQQLDILVKSINDLESLKKLKNWFNKSIIYIRDNWEKLQDSTKLEKEETIIAFSILKKYILNQGVTVKELTFLKHQSLDLVKVFFLICTRFVPLPLPILPTLIWISKKTKFNFFPNSHLKKLDEIKNPNHKW
jgi:S-methylmethionine-dependent homocysteine/selenocysteine methylase